MKKLFLFITALTLCAGLWAMDGVHYIDANGQEQTADNVTEITYASSTLSAGWYVVTGTDVKIAGLLCVGAVHLIIADGAKCTIRGGIIISGIGNSLTIYGQTDQSGQLFAIGQKSGVAGIGGGNGDHHGSNITINGGTVTATGGRGGAGIGGGEKGSGLDITINSGEVTAVGGEYAAGIGGGKGGHGSYITINGGAVTATGGRGGAGIGGGEKSLLGRGDANNITIRAGKITATGGDGGGSGIGGGGGAWGLRGTASKIKMATDLIVKADNNNPPTTIVASTRTDDTDIANELSGKRYVTIENPSEDTALPTLPYEDRSRKGALKVLKDGQFRIIRETKTYNA